MAHRLAPPPPPEADKHVLCSVGAYCSAAAPARPVYFRIFYIGIILFRDNFTCMKYVVVVNIKGETLFRQLVKLAQWVAKVGLA